MFRTRLKTEQETTTAVSAAERLQTQIADRISGMFDAVLEERRAHFTQHPDEVPAGSPAETIIRSYANQNALLSGGAGLVPGPLGMLAVVPEIALVIRNQIAMVHDIGRAHGKEAILNRNLLAGIVLTGLGGSAGALLTMHGGKVFVRRAALRAFQRIVALLAGKVTQQVLKSMISRYLPLLGAAAMAAWSKYMTHQVGRKAVEIFGCEIKLLDNALDVSDVPPDESTEDAPVLMNRDRPPSSLETNRIRALINLMKVDGSMGDAEREHLQVILNSADLPQGEREQLSRAMEEGSTLDIDYEALSGRPDVAVGLLVDLVAMAQRDGTFHAAERLYIQQAGKRLGFGAEDVADLMTGAA